MDRPETLFYRLNRKIRRAAKHTMRLLKAASAEKPLDLQKEKIEKILLVRATSRMGDTILATPAIAAFRKSFPGARIDYVGGPIAAPLFLNLPVDHVLKTTRRFPRSMWAYLVLIAKLRSVRYDLAVDVSCAHSAMGAFLVGYSRARFRVGLRGQWDRWFNVRIARPREKNKYRMLPAFLAGLGLAVPETLPSLVLWPAEQEAGRKRIEALVGARGGPVVGVFVGGRKTWGKRRPIESFYQLIKFLMCEGARVVTFFGPDEKHLLKPFRRLCDGKIPAVFEPAPRPFAAMVSHCHLFVTCDSGPMHMACALGTRTVAMFQKPNFDRWSPPPDRAQIAYEPDGCSVNEVMRLCQVQLSATSKSENALHPSAS